MVSDSAHYPDGICFLSNKPLTIVKMILVTNLLNSLRICYFNPMLLSKLTIKNQNSIPVFIAKPAIVRNPPLAARPLPQKDQLIFWVSKSGPNVRNEGKTWSQIDNPPKYD